MIRRSSHHSESAVEAVKPDFHFRCFAWLRVDASPCVQVHENVASPKVPPPSWWKKVLQIWVRAPVLRMKTVRPESGSTDRFTAYESQETQQKFVDLRARVASLALRGQAHSGHEKTPLRSSLPRHSLTYRLNRHRRHSLIRLQPLARKTAPREIGRVVQKRCRNGAVFLPQGSED